MAEPIATEPRAEASLTAQEVEAMVLDKHKKPWYRTNPFADHGWPWWLCFTLCFFVIACGAAVITAARSQGASADAVKSQKAANTVLVEILDDNRVETNCRAGRVAQLDVARARLDAAQAKYDIAQSQWIEALSARDEAGALAARLEMNRVTMDEYPGLEQAVLDAAVQREEALKECAELVGEEDPATAPTTNP